MIEKKKILILIDSSRLSGPGRQVLQIFEHINRDTYDLVLGVPVVGECDTELIDEARRRGLALLIFRQRHSFDPLILGPLRRKVKAHGIDIVQTHGYKPSVLGFLLKYLCRCRWLHFMHGHTAEDSKVAIYFRIEFALARFADRIVTVSNEMRRRLVARGLPETTTTVHNALDPDQFNSESESVYREQFSVSREEPLIGVIGRLSPEKGPDVFLEAFRAFLSEYEMGKAMLIGEGPLEQELRGRVADFGLEEKVLFVGYQPSISMFYPLLDLLVLPSRSEGLPNVAMEAMYFGVPVVASRVGGTPEIVLDGETGLLVPSDSPDQLAAAMCNVLRDSSLRASFIENGRSLCREKFSPDARVRQIEKLYGSLLASSAQ